MFYLLKRIQVRRQVYMLLNIILQLFKQKQNYKCSDKKKKAVLD